MPGPPPRSAFDDMSFLIGRLGDYLSAAPCIAPVDIRFSPDFTSRQDMERPRQNQPRLPKLVATGRLIPTVVSRV